MKVAILDFDGTLFESAPYWEEVIHTYLTGHGVEPPPDLLSVVKPLGVSGGAGYFKERFGLAEEVPQIVRDWRTRMGRNYHEMIPLREYAGEYLGQLSARGIPVCLATAMERDFVIPALERTGVLRLFDLILTIAEVRADKLSPRIYQACADRFDVAPADCTVFEDSPQAVRTCAAAGFRVVGVYDGVCHNERDELRESCDLFIDSFSELLEGERSAS